MKRLLALLGLMVSGCVQPVTDDVGEAYDPSAPMSVGEETEGAEPTCAEEPWAFLPIDAFRLRVEPPPADGPWRASVFRFLLGLGGEELVDPSIRVVANALRLDSVELEPGDPDFPGAVVAIAEARDDGVAAPVEVQASGSYADQPLEPRCAPEMPEGFLVTTMPYPDVAPQNPRGPTPLSTTWRATLVDGALMVENRIAMRPGEEPLDLEAERDQLARKMVEWFPNELPEQRVELRADTLVMTLTADTEAEVDALLHFLAGMIPEVLLSAEPSAD